jgi:hypothetical protein
MIIVRRFVKSKSSANFAYAPDFKNMYWDEAEEARAKANKSKIDPRLLLAGLGVAGAVGAGAYFIRRRRSKNGKQIVERVKR